jgi:hypothetical protein
VIPGGVEERLLQAFLLPLRRELEDVHPGQQLLVQRVHQRRGAHVDVLAGGHRVVEELRPLAGEPIG